MRKVHTEPRRHGGGFWKSRRLKWGRTAGEAEGIARVHGPNDVALLFLWQWKNAGGGFWTGLTGLGRDGEGLSRSHGEHGGGRGGKLESGDEEGVARSPNVAGSKGVPKLLRRSLFCVYSAFFPAPRSPALFCVYSALCGTW